MQTVSKVNTALAETRRRENARVEKSGSAAPASSATKLSKLEQVKLRVRAKLHATESGLAQNSEASSGTGISCPSSVSRFEVARRRIKVREMRAKGVVPEAG